MHVMSRRSVLSALAVLLLGTAAVADSPVYREPNEYPVLDEITARREAMIAAQDSLIQLKRAQQKADTDLREDIRQDLRVDWSKIEIPESPESFRINTPHLPPVPQFNTGTCWAFCSTSFMESEVIRMTGQRIKLSEMWVVYWEYVEKVRRYVREYGDSVVEEGGESDGTLHTYAKYGVVPEEAYPGVLFADGRHDHHLLVEQLHAWLDLVKAQGIWNEDEVIAGARLILDAHLGAPPETVTWTDGRTLTPIQFRDEILKIHPEDYVSVVSRMDRPFEEFGLLDVPDNWRRSEDYLNLPLDSFSKIIKESLRKGYTVDIGGDNSEPGLDGKMDAAVIPDWDIPSRYIDQGSREFRIVNGTTTDDHGIHIVGFTRLGGRDWYLIKDSNRSSRLGKHKGYYFFDGDYIKLKMLSFMVHKDMLQGYLPR